MINREIAQVSGYSDRQFAAKESGLPRQWNFRFLKEYLLALAREPKNLLSKNEYPQRIQLDSSMHEAFNKVRNLTRKDNIERWLMIGHKEDKRALYLQNTPVNGNSRFIPEVVISEELKKAKMKGFEQVGDVHSHPSGISEKLKDIFFVICGKHIGISEEDIHYILDRKSVFTEGITTLNHNYLVFKSKETGQQSEMYYDDDPSVLPPNNEITLANPRKTAKTNHVVVYRGRVGEDLVRLPL